jgi:hypothetical protein
MVGDTMTFDPVDWVNRNTGHTCTDDEARCLAVLTAIDRPYNLMLGSERWDDVEWLGHGIIVYLFGELSTFDWSNLTRVVVLAHRHAVRVAIRPAIRTQTDRDSFLSRRDEKGMWVTDEHPTYDVGALCVQLTARAHDAEHMFARHATVADLVDMCTSTTNP